MSASQSAKHALNVELPQGWHAVDTATLVLSFAGDRARAALDEVIGEEPAQDLQATLPAIWEGLRETGVVLAGMRVTEDRLDTILVALPPEEMTRTVDGGDAEATPASRVNEVAHRVSVGAAPAIEHETVPHAGQTTTTSVVQLVMFVPPTHRGAIITVRSTAAGVEEELSEVAQSVGETLRVVTLDH